jgi:hypothetical protein
MTFRGYDGANSQNQRVHYKRNIRDEFSRDPRGARRAKPAAGVNLSVGPLPKGGHFAGAVNSTGALQWLQRLVASL